MKTFFLAALLALAGLSGAITTAHTALAGGQIGAHPDDFRSGK